MTDHLHDSRTPPRMLQTEDKRGMTGALSHLGPFPSDGVRLSVVRRLGRYPVTHQGLPNARMHVTGTPTVNLFTVGLHREASTHRE